MRTYLACIQPCPHGAIPRHILNTINSFLCCFSNYLENRLLPNDLSIVRNHGDEEDDIWDTKDDLETPRDVNNKVEIQTNLEFQSLILSPTQSPGLPCIQINAQYIYDLQFGCSTYAWKDKEINLPTPSVSSSTKILSRPQSSKQNQFSEPSWYCVTYFWLMAHVSNWSPLGMCSTV
jgi:hypothetical protein